MSANEKAYYPMESLLGSFTPGENTWKQHWRPKKVDAIPDFARQAQVPAVNPEMLGLVQCVFLAPATLSPKRVMFCGIDGNDSSEVCASAGRILAEQTRSNVCLVNANRRDRRLLQMFDLDQRRPLRGNASWRDQCVCVARNLFVAGADVLEEGDGAFASAKELKERIAALSSSFEYILFDASGANTSSETGLLGQIAGAAVLVLDSNSTRRVDAKKAKERLEMANIRILGTVLQNHSN